MSGEGAGTDKTKPYFSQAPRQFIFMSSFNLLPSPMLEEIIITKYMSTLLTK